MCARRLPPSLTPRPCGACLTKPPAFQRCVAVAEYQSALRPLIHRFKYQREWRLAWPLALLLKEALVRFEMPTPQALVAVPLARHRLRVRGFNQAGELAAKLAQMWSVPCYHGWVSKRDDRPIQTGLNAEARRRNARGAYVVRKPPAQRHFPTHVAIVDDVMTTGASVNEVARVLHSQGVRRIDVWVLARAN